MQDSLRCNWMQCKVTNIQGSSLSLKEGQSPPTREDGSLIWIPQWEKGLLDSVNQNIIDEALKASTQHQVSIPLYIRVDKLTRTADHQRPKTYLKWMILNTSTILYAENKVISYEGTNIDNGNKDIQHQLWWSPTPIHLWDQFWVKWDDSWCCLKQSLSQFHSATTHWPPRVWCGLSQHYEIKRAGS